MKSYVDKKLNVHICDGKKLGVSKIRWVSRSSNRGATVQLLTRHITRTPPED